MTPPAAPPPARPPLFAAAAILVAAAVLASLPQTRIIDSEVRFEALDRLLRDGTVAGSKFSMIGPLFAAPLWFLGEAAGNTTNVVWLFSRLAFLAGSAALWWALRPALGADAARRFVVAAALASLVPYHLLHFTGEVFTAVCVAVGTAAAVTRGKAWGWALAAVGAANTPATLPALALAAAVVCWERRRLRYGLAVAAAAGLVLAENYARRGDPLAGGYANDHGFPTLLPYAGRPGFSYPLFFGVLSVLFSFGKGLVFFAPGLFVPLDRVRGNGSEADHEADVRLLYRAWLAFVVGLVVVYSKWWAWYGGVFWGPRFFLFASLPAALVIARRTARPSDSLGVNLVVAAVVLLSCWAGANGAVYQLYADGPFYANNYALESALWYVPECSSLWRPFVVHRPIHTADRLRLIAFGVGAAYLLTPLAGVAARQLRDRAAAAWAAFRAGPRFRF